MVNYKEIITIEPGKRGGKPCIRGLRITVNDIYAALSFAADRENKTYHSAV